MTRQDSDQQMTTAPHREDQVVAALPNLGAVRDAMTALGVEITDQESDEQLGLALLTVTAGPGWQPGPGADQTAPESFAGQVIGQVRQYFADRGGWLPTLGKNRITENVAAMYVISGGDQGVPQLASGTAVPVPDGTDMAEFAPDSLIIGGRYATGSVDIAEAFSHRPGAPDGRPARVAVLDTKVYPLPWLAGGYLADSSSVIPVGTDPQGDPQHAPLTAGHGTYIAGLIMAQAAGVTVDIYGVLDDDANADSWSLATQIVRAAARGVDVVNLSCGCFTEDNEPPLVLATAISRLGLDTIAVAAAGNHGVDRPGTPFWPAALDDVIAVGARTPTGARAPFSPDAPWVDLLAPGVNVVSTYFDGRVTVDLPAAAGEPARTQTYPGYAAWSGTSAAAAWASGLLAARIGDGMSPRAAWAQLYDAAAKPSSVEVPVP
jgi:hypothetical protein